MRFSSKTRYGVALAAFTAVATLSLAAVAADKIGNCEVTGKKGEFSIKPAIAGQLTYETNLPAPGWNNGDTPEAIKDGYEYCLAANIAWRLGLDKVVVKNVDFDALVAGQTKDFDIALSQISITDKRKEVVQFSVPYFDSDVGVLAKKGKKVEAGDMKNLRIGVQQGTTGADFVADTLKPKTPAKVFPDTPAMFTALMANQIDVAMTDTAIVVPQAATSGGKQVVVGQYSTGEKYGALFPKGAASAATIDKIIAALVADGTTKKLEKKYLAGDMSKIPAFKP
ncbi:amino acid ABC transporter substrate-binding protein [Siculibacillus lacustris]|uniref:Amino acid ABC transporter substrate-binding protein n=1 Tax=Siculibacillus lacustris TaxID=1549641 RepID=A0A4Q9VV66_9HYPH|nr:ABC transporter substrate-binding protein [Siculibacillus lacustris]TBW40019.1 amino acid ABC transporter substrate-binding protein [Siculibacillus lacustris]